MKKVLLTLTAAILVTITSKAQDSTSTPLSISGSADAYWKYDFAKTGNIGTSFASDHNSLSLGMIDIALKKTTGKASFVGEISFGPRGQGQSIPDADPAGSSFNIQNLYATYAFTDKFSMTAGYMGTFVGYEVISPVGNFHYSTSYLFTNGPFQNAGIKANYAISSKVGIMAGLFQDSWNTYVANPSLGLNTFGAQLSLAPVEGWSAYLNFASGSASGTIYDLTTAYQITKKFKLGLNAADFSNGTDVGYTGFALYPSVAVTDAFALGLRGENFKFKKNSGDDTITALTLTANLKSGGLNFIPEFRLDNAKTNTFGFIDANGAATKSATQFSMAVVYAF
jgi:hypothetical protein